MLELTAVVIIIGILARIALFGFSRMSEKNRAAEGRMALIAIRAAQLRYYADHNQYTDTIGDLDLTYTTPKYFFPPGAYSHGGSPPTIYLGIIVRLTSPDNLPAYKLRISDTGNIICSDDTIVPAVSPTCADIGMSSSLP